MTQCQYCGSENESWYVYCQNCGKKLAAPAADRQVGDETKDDLSADLLEVAAGSETEDLGGQPTVAIPEQTERAAAAQAPPIPAPRPPEPPTPPGGARSCPHCDASMPDMYRYCGLCGMSLAGEPSSATAAPAPAGGVAAARLLRLREDGSTDSGIVLQAGETVLGRETGEIVFPSDSLMSRRHVSIRAEGGALYLKDLGSTNGTFLRIRKKTILRNGDYLLVGRQLLRFERVSEGEDAGAAAADQTMVLGSAVEKHEARLIKRLPSGKDSNEFPLTEKQTVIGREKGDILFKNDPFVSGRHAAVERVAGTFSLEDLGSSNGTYLRLREEAEIRSDDFFIVGEQLFQVTLLES